MLRELFNERRWRSNDLGSLEVTVRHRGAPGDERTIPGHAITDVSGHGFSVREDAEWSFGAEEEEQPTASEGDVFIPWHRVLRVTGPEGELYRKREASDG